MLRKPDIEALEDSDPKYSPLLRSRTMRNTFKPPIDTTMVVGDHNEWLAIRSLKEHVDYRKTNGSFSGPQHSRLVFACSRSGKLSTSVSKKGGRVSKGCACPHRVTIYVIRCEPGVFYIRDDASHAYHVLGSSEDKQLLTIFEPIRQRVINDIRNGLSNTTVLERMNNLLRIQKDFFTPLGISMKDLPPQRYIITNRNLADYRCSIKRKLYIAKDDTMALNAILFDNIETKSLRPECILFVPFKLKDKIENTIQTSHSRLKKLETKGKDASIDQHLLFVIQTEWQRSMLRQYGSHLIFLDSTGGVNQYGMELFAIVVQGVHGSGVPVAMFVTSSGKADVVESALNAVFRNCTGPNEEPFLPRYCMIDNCDSEIQALTNLGIKPIICYFHFLQAIQRAMRRTCNQVSKHYHAFITEQCRRIGRARVEADMHEAHLQLNTFLEVNDLYIFKAYFSKEWSAKSKLVSQAGSPSVQARTNNLIERFFKRVKYEFLDRQINRRVSNLVCIILERIEPYFKNRALLLQKLSDTTDRQAVSNRVRSLASEIIDNWSQRTLEVASTPLSVYVIGKGPDFTRYRVCTAEDSCSCLAGSAHVVCHHLVAVREVQPLTNDKFDQAVENIRPRLVVENEANTEFSVTPIEVVDMPQHSAETIPYNVFPFELACSCNFSMRRRARFVKGPLPRRWCAHIEAARRLVNAEPLDPYSVSTDTSGQFSPDCMETEDCLPQHVHQNTHRAQLQFKTYRDVMEKRLHPLLDLTKELERMIEKATKIPGEQEVDAIRKELQASVDNIRCILEPYDDLSRQTLTFPAFRGGDNARTVQPLHPKRLHKNSACARSIQPSEEERLIPLGAQGGRPRSEGSFHRVGRLHSEAELRQHTKRKRTASGEV